MTKPRRKHPSERKTEVIFVRVTPPERELIDRAIAAKYGDIQSNISRFVRTAVLLYVKKILLKQGKGD